VLTLSSSAGDRVVWQRLAEADLSGGHIDPLLGRYKSQQFQQLVRRWVPSLDGLRLLKTDLREEACGEDEVLFSLPRPGEQPWICGVDISALVTRRAAAQADRRGLAQHQLTCDVRALPFADGSFDVVLSNSTLDHFPDERSLRRALGELSRVLAPGGRLVLTLNNRDNALLFGLWNAEQLLRRRGYPVQFFRPAQVTPLLEQQGLSVRRQDAIINVVCPANSVLLAARRVLPGGAEMLVDRAAELFLGLARWLGRAPATRRRTAWFIALECLRAGGPADPVPAP
jgi:SAM-dependent methyltransferase